MRSRFSIKRLKPAARQLGRCVVARQLFFLAHSPLCSSLPLSFMIVANAQLAQNTNTIISHRRALALCARLPSGHPRRTTSPRTVFISVSAAPEGQVVSCMSSTSRFLWKKITGIVSHWVPNVFAVITRLLFGYFTISFFPLLCWRLRARDKLKCWG